MDVRGLSAPGKADFLLVGSIPFEELVWCFLGDAVPTPGFQRARGLECPAAGGIC